MAWKWSQVLRQCKHTLIRGLLYFYSRLMATFQEQCFIRRHKKGWTSSFPRLVLTELSILIEERTLHKIQTELAAKFGGLTRYPAFNGSSTGSDGQVHDDINNAGLFVVAPNTHENIEWFSTYKQTLEARLDQDGIFMMICLSAHNCVRAENIDR